MMSCAFSISCRWVVVLCCQNNMIILCCHHIMTSRACFILCCWVTMLYWMFGTYLTSEPSHFDNVQFSSQITSHSPSLARPNSNNTPDWVMRCWGCTSPGSLLSWFIYVKGTTRGEYILTESKFCAKTWGVYLSPFPSHNIANLHKCAIVNMKIKVSD